MIWDLNRLDCAYSVCVGTVLRCVFAMSSLVQFILVLTQ